MLEILVMMMFIVVFMDWLVILNFLILLFLYGLTTLDGSYNSVSTIMVMLSIWLVIMMILSVTNLEKKNILLVLFIFTLCSLQICFSSESLFFFYLGFEMSVLPILLIIFGWGYQPDRITAGFYMLCYTILFSLPFLVGIYLLNSNFAFQGSFMMFFFFMSGFLVKLPMFGAHLWLPRAHVEAPVYGSMILAGVMLKLGGYGVIKISIELGDYFYFYSDFFVVFSILGGIFLSVICFVQSDIKVIIAYSSVVHMSLVISGLLTFKEIGLIGSMYLMVGHGLCSSGMFCLLGLNYVRSQSRSLYINKGYLSIIPSCSLWWFLFCSSNLSFPPSLNLPGEIFILSSIMQWCPNLFCLLILLNFFSSMYSIYLYSFSQHGQAWTFFPFLSFNLSEHLSLLLHWLPLNLLVLDLGAMSLY